VHLLRRLWLSSNCLSYLRQVGPNFAAAEASFVAAHAGDGGYFNEDLPIAALVASCERLSVIGKWIRALFRENGWVDATAGDK
jgi:hypothetical protein